MEESIVIHKLKNEDYAGEGIDTNFERVAVIQSWFDNPIDKAFAGFVAVKLARLAILLNSGRKPKNESIHDSFLDGTTYMALWGANSDRRLKQGTYAENWMDKPCETEKDPRDSQKSQDTTRRSTRG